MEVIKTHDLVKTYGEAEVEVHAVDHVNLSIKQGEFTLL